MDGLVILIVNLKKKIRKQALGNILITIEQMYLI